LDVLIPHNNWDFSNFPCKNGLIPEREKVMTEVQAVVACLKHHKVKVLDDFRFGEPFEN